jgi:glutamate synthase domain-containing protein 2
MFVWLQRLDQHFPVRYSAWLACAVGMMLAAFSWVAFDRGGTLALIFLALTLLGVRDTRQARHAVLRNYPVIGHLRFLLEYIRPEMRQYFIEGDNEAAPFSRQQRSLVYQRAKGDSDKRPFGTQMDVHAVGYEWINHSLQPSKLSTHDFRVTIGAGRAQPYDASVFNISAMSFGALSANAVLALNEGARRGGFAHDTGEGSISRHHRANGGDLIWEIGSGYFGCRHGDGSFSEERFIENARLPQVKMVELKLSQGAKPGHGGVLPGPKVTAEIAEARGVPVGTDCISPSAHSAFATPIEMLRFIDRLRCGGLTKDVLKKGVAWEIERRFRTAAELTAALATSWNEPDIETEIEDDEDAPVAAVVLMCASLTGANPFTLAKRVAVPLLAGIAVVVVLRVLHVF